MPIWAKLSLPNANSPLMEQMTFFHDHTLMILIMITILILYMLILSSSNKLINKNLLEGQELETIWTSIPAILLIFIAFPSLQILYMMEEAPSPLITIKIIGHQWYWSYQYSDFKNIYFDSFILMKSKNPSNNFRLLETDNHMMVPILISSRLLITSNDVIHSWTIPTLSVKADATPGRINQIMINPSRPGLFFGQCSEICGAKHSFMPITMECLPMKMFMKWITISSSL